MVPRRAPQRGWEGLLVVEALRAGFAVAGLVVKGSVRRGRFPEEVNVEVGSCIGGVCGRVARVKVFAGRPPYYRPWIEVFDQSPSPPAIVEDLLLDLAGASLGPGGRLYVEYWWDPVTVAELERGVHPALTRLGYKMLLRGFTWFKDWYFPEGFMEGGQKLEGEKPLDARGCRRHLEEIALAARRLASGDGRGVVLAGAVARARGVLALAGEGAEGCPGSFLHKRQ